MNGILLMLFSATFLMGFECRSISIAFSHTERFEVKEEKERAFIDLSDDIVQLLDLDKPSIEDELESQLEKLDKDLSDDEDVENDNEELEDDDYNGYKNSDDYETDVMFEDEKSPRLRKENTHMDYEDIENDDEVIDNGSRLKRHFRSKRAIGGREQWRQSLPGYKKSKRKNRDEIVWEDVTDKDLRRAKYEEFTRTVKYVGMTLLSVTCFVFIGYCFIRDPVAFVFAFGTGCPCCIICCPCIRKFTDKYLDVKKIIRDSMNRYMPGIILKEDGTFDTYEPTPEELAIMEEILDEILE